MLWVWISLAMAEDLQFDDEVPAVAVPTTYQNARWLQHTVSKRAFVDAKCSEALELELKLGDDPCRLTVGEQSLDFTGPLTQKALSRVSYALDLEGRCVASEGPLSGVSFAPAERVWNAVAFQAEQCGGRVEGRQVGVDAVWSEQARQYPPRPDPNWNAAVTMGSMPTGTQADAQAADRAAVSQALQAVLGEPLVVQSADCSEQAEVRFVGLWWQPSGCVLSVSTRSGGSWGGKAQSGAREQQLDLSKAVSLSTVPVGLGEACTRGRLPRVGEGALVVLPEPVGAELYGRLSAVAQGCGGSLSIDGVPVEPAEPLVWVESN